MTTTPLADLSNAAVINAIVQDARLRPDAWATARWKASEIWNIAGKSNTSQYVQAVWYAAHARTSVASKDLAWDVVQNLNTDTLTSALWGIVQALVEWPESAALLDLTPDAVRTIIDTCEGDARHQAVLLLPAVIARSTP